MEFEGSAYSGWQRQENAMSIQEIIENALLKVTGENITVYGCSRTDAGVHAKAYVCNFHTDSQIPPDKFRRAINANIPRDIVVFKSQEVFEEFNSRYHSKGKTYSYTILNRKETTALNRNFCYHYVKTLDTVLMQEAAILFLGEHDFASFRNKGSSAKTTVRTVKKVSVIKDGDYIKIYITADGFLYNMARIIVGTLISVGRGDLAPEEINSIILSKDRKNAGKSAPAKGLCLEEVFYD